MDKIIEISHLSKSYGDIKAVMIYPLVFITVNCLHFSA